MASQAQNQEMTVALRTNRIWLYAPDTNKPVETITNHAGLEKLPTIALCSDPDGSGER